MVFVLEHGGKDLESFVLLNFDEAQSLLVQVNHEALALLLVGMVNSISDPFSIKKL